MISTAAPVPTVVFDQLAGLTTPRGLFEHAELSLARPEHGFCLDDVARGLVVVAREPHPTPAVTRLGATYLAFVLAAQDDAGRFHNRRDVDGRWTDRPSTDDHWGRALWALGVAANEQTASGQTAGRDVVLAATRALSRRSPWWHAMAYAAVGAAELLRACPGHRQALDLLGDARAMLAVRPPDPAWPWLGPRLTYADAVLPEALIAIGTALGDDDVLAMGLATLRWAVDHHSIDGHLSLTPVGGWAPGEPRPGFDQQPVEAVALAEACWRAWGATADTGWLAAIELCVGWFLGRNDVGVTLYDARTGGGYDGLERLGVNRNQGAESTLAALATLQLGARAARHGCGATGPAVG